jgi:hypothetical protein
MDEVEKAAKIPIENDTYKLISKDNKAYKK